VHGMAEHEDTRDARTISRGRPRGGTLLPSRESLNRAVLESKSEWMGRARGMGRSRHSQTPIENDTWFWTVDHERPAAFKRT